MLASWKVSLNFVSREFALHYQRNRETVEVMGELGTV